MIPGLSFSHSADQEKKGNLPRLSGEESFYSQKPRLIGLEVLCHPKPVYKASGHKAGTGEVVSQRKWGVLVARVRDAGCPREMSCTAQGAELVSDLVHVCTYPLGSDKLLRG